MKRGVRLAAGLAAVGLFALALTGCEGDRGPAGPAGTTECFGCHTDDFTMAAFIRPYQQDFAASQHALGDTFARRDAPCSRCHTNEGFQAYVNTGVEVDVADASRIHCFTCHAPHSNFDFSLRVMGPAALQSEGVRVAVNDFDRGPSNTCATCHQARPASPAIDSGAEITSSRWGTHHGPQANVLMGDGAWVFSTGTAYSTGPSHKAIPEGCVHCHMGPSAGTLTGGGHTFKPVFEDHGTEEINGQACIDCHDEWTDDDEAATADVEAYQATFNGDLLAVVGKLITLGVISADSTDMTVIPSIAGRPRTFTGTAGADTLGCVYNLVLLMEDKSQGVHNVAFEEDVVAAMKTFLGI